jgi:hypothetical protein
MTEQQQHLPATCWCCNDADEAWYCSACGGHGDDTRIPIRLACPSCQTVGKSRQVDYDTGRLACGTCGAKVVEAEKVGL